MSYIVYSERRSHWVVARRVGDIYVPHCHCQTKADAMEIARALRRSG